MSWREVINMLSLTQQSVLIVCLLVMVILTVCPFRRSLQLLHAPASLLVCIIFTKYILTIKRGVVAFVMDSY